MEKKSHNFSAKFVKVCCVSVSLGGVVWCILLIFFKVSFRQYSGTVCSVVSLGFFRQKRGSLRSRRGRPGYGYIL